MDGLDLQRLITALLMPLPRARPLEETGLVVKESLEFGVQVGWRG